MKYVSGLGETIDYVLFKVRLIAKMNNSRLFFVDSSASHESKQDSSLTKLFCVWQPPEKKDTHSASPDDLE